MSSNQNMGDRDLEFECFNFLGGIFQGLLCRFQFFLRVFQLFLNFRHTMGIFFGTSSQLQSLLYK